jgi:hypothetical protein
VGPDRRAPPCLAGAPAWRGLPGHAWPRLRPDVPQRLLAAGRILPLLDGLDELPEEVRAIAIAELDRAHGTQPLVLTCRSEEFEQAVAAGGALAAAAVVELEPVTAGQAAAFLRTTASPAVAARWDQVADHLRAHPDGHLALALSTPLLAALARTVDADPGRDPAELVALAQAGGQAGVQNHLLEGFIPAAFAVRPPAPGSLVPPRRWDPQAARRWLTVLAVHLERHHTRDVAWWQLHRGIGLEGGLILLFLLGLAGLLDDFLRRPVDTTLAVTPRSVHHRDRTVTIVRGLMGGLTLGLAFGLSGRVSGGVAVGLTAGLEVGLVGGAWGRFTLVRGWLALRGYLPWRLLGFLDDAHRLGVLRQAGAVYQFRHALLHDHLTATSRTPPTRRRRP